MDARRRATATLTATVLALAATLSGCAAPAADITVDDYTGTWVAEDLDVTVTLDDDWSMTIRGEDTDQIVPFTDSVDTVWTPEVRVDDYGPYARWAYVDEERKQEYTGDMYFIGTRDEPRITLFGPESDIHLVPAD